MQSKDKSKSNTYRKSVHPILKLKALANTALGISVETDLRVYRDIVRDIKACDLEHIPDSGLRDLSVGLAGRARSGVPLENFLVEAFALVRQASRRAIGLSPFDVQMIAGLAMAQGENRRAADGRRKNIGRSLRGLCPCIDRPRRSCLDIQRLPGPQGCRLDGSHL